METCPTCNAPQHAFVMHCAACGQPLGFPNVRAADTLDEVAGLDARLELATNTMISKGLTGELQSLLAAVETYSNVIVTMSAVTSLTVVTESESQYVNYERLVGSGVRGPATFANDAHRRVAAGALFGSAGTDIIYGALSLSDRGLATYGDVYCRLKRLTIEARTSFLDTNSYAFVKKYGDFDHPPGHRSNWLNRGKLAAIKLVESDSIKKGDGMTEWEQCILVSDGTNRERDDFIEAHIFGTFTAFSIEKMTPTERPNVKDRKVVDAAIQAFQLIAANR
jgi:hypothetical protein